MAWGRAYFGLVGGWLACGGMMRSLPCGVGRKSCTVICWWWRWWRWCGGSVLGLSSVRFFSSARSPRAVIPPPPPPLVRLLFFSIFSAADIFEWVWRDWSGEVVIPHRLGGWLCSGLGSVPSRAGGLYRRRGEPTTYQRHHMGAVSVSPITLSHLTPDSIITTTTIIYCPSCDPSSISNRAARRIAAQCIKQPRLCRVAESRPA